MAGSVIQIDETDRVLIAALRENARAPAAVLARRLGLSRTTVQSRLERLERARVITGYTVKLSEAHERGQILAYVMITVAPKQSAAVVQVVRGLTAVRLLQSVSGTFDFIALIAAPSVAEVDQVIDAIGMLEGVDRTTSSIVMSTKFDR
ncbi:MAG TPA: Lrp/AsnC family transcriptional regulator [Caulobacteraceae bacterium]|jgi:DNA-binding Lrp family transcriptional regulator